MSIQIRYQNTRYGLNVRAVALLLIACGLSACGNTRIAHFDGTPFIERGERLDLDNGWVAIDSCAAGQHAVLVMEVEAFGIVSPTPRGIMGKELGTLRDFRLEGPWCRTKYDGFYGEAFDADPWLRKYGCTHGEEHCVYRLRTEYTLDASFTPPDSVYLAHFQNVVSRSSQ